ncbi:MAG: YgiQ family radical SAM protein [Thermoguttaceae bacterium]
MSLSETVENSPLPISRVDMEQRGWDEVDIVFVTGDAYVDHPSFATALLGRVLEADGFRVGILSQPDWHSAEPWTIFGKPRLCFCISAGNMDSMINHYTANRKVRNDDAYSPGGKIGLRPDRATLAYCQRAREAFPGTPVITGGVEASLRRFAHYDYWSDKVKRSILMDSKADLLVYGMGETPLLEVVRGLAAGKTILELRDLRGIVYRLGASEDLPPEDGTTIHLPSCEEVIENKERFSEMTRIAYQNLNPYTALRLVQEHLHEAIVVNPPSLPLSEDEMDRIYGLPFTRKPHPSYGKAEIPAYNVIKHSVQILRGCFGGCAFCSLTAHQGKFIQSRSEASICKEVRELTTFGDFRGMVSDLGGPTANMYKLGCKEPELRKSCNRLSCLHPEICVNLQTDHKAVIRLMRDVREIPNIKQVFIASGVRTDLAQLDPAYVEELVKYHVGGHLKTAPEHSDPDVLDLMGKPPIDNYLQFCELFEHLSHNNGKEQFLVPYMIAGLPGSTLPKMVEVACFLKNNGIRPQQVQEFIPGPFEIATSMYYTGMDPLTRESVYSAKGLRERRLQKALLLYHDLDHYHDVKTALKEAGREDLIGDNADCLIPAYPPKSMSFRQSSRIKRLTRKEMREKAQKALFREEQQLIERKRRRERGDRPDRGERPTWRDRSNDANNRDTRGDRPDRGERPNWRDRSNDGSNRDTRGDRNDRGASPNWRDRSNDGNNRDTRGDRTDRGGSPTWRDRSNDANNRDTRGDRTDRGDRPTWQDRSNNGNNRDTRGDRPDRGERPNWRDRPNDGNNRDTRGDRTDRGASANWRDRSNDGNNRDTRGDRPDRGARPNWRDRSNDGSNRDTRGDRTDRGDRPTWRDRSNDGNNRDTRGDRPDRGASPNWRDRSNDGNNRGTRGDRNDRGASPNWRDRPNDGSNRDTRGDRPDRGARPNWRDRPNDGSNRDTRGDRPDRGASPNWRDRSNDGNNRDTRGDRPDRGARPNWRDRSNDANNRDTRGDRPDQGARPNWRDRSNDGNNRDTRGDRPDRGDRPNWRDRPNDGNNRDTRGDRTDRGASPNWRDRSNDGNNRDTRGDRPDRGARPNWRDRPNDGNNRDTRGDRTDRGASPNWRDRSNNANNRDTRGDRPDRGERRPNGPGTGSNRPPKTGFRPKRFD